MKSQYNSILSLLRLFKIEKCHSEKLVFKGTIGVISSEPLFKGTIGVISSEPLFKGTIGVISSEPLFKEGHARFTIEPFEPLIK